MKTKPLNLFYTLLLTALITLSISASAEAARYYFSQKLTENGRISGSFTGEDTGSRNLEDGYNENNSPDGKITSFANDFYEITEFKMYYSGNSFLNGLNCKDNSCGHQLQRFEYDIANNTLSLLNYGYKNENSGAWYIDFIAPDTFVGGASLVAQFFSHDGSSAYPSVRKQFKATSPLVITQTTPIPAALFLFASGFSGLILLLRDKSRLR